MKRMWLGIIFGAAALTIVGMTMIIGHIRASAMPFDAPADIPLLSHIETSLPSPATIATPEATPTPTPSEETTAPTAAAETDLPTSTPTETFAPHAPKPFPTAKPTSSATSNPTPAPVTTVRATVTRGDTTCTSLWIVPSTEAAHYLAGQTYYGVHLNSNSSTAQIAKNTAENSLAYVVNDTGYTCLISYQYASTGTGATVSFNASTTVESIAYPELSGSTAYELSERLRRLHLLSTYSDLETYVTNGIKTQTLQSLAEQASYLAKIKAVTAQYDSSYPPQF